MQTIEQVICKQTTKDKVANIMRSVSWLDITMTYFKGRSSSWFYNKLHERDINK